MLWSEQVNVQPGRVFWYFQFYSREPSMHVSMRGWNLMCFCLLELSSLHAGTDNLCKQFGCRSAPIKYRDWPKSKLFGTLKVLLKDFPFWKTFILKRNYHENLPRMQSIKVLKQNSLYALSRYLSLSYDVASGSEITPCNKIDKSLVVYRFTGTVMTSITTLRT